MGTSFGTLGELRRFTSSCWYEVTGKISEGHLHVGTRVEAVKRWKEATSYAERYMAKPEVFPDGLKTGSLRDAFRIRRIYRKLARRKGSGSLRRITVFSRHENVVKLLRFLGYCLE